MEEKCLTSAEVGILNALVKAEKTIKILSGVRLLGGVEMKEHQKNEKVLKRAAFALSKPKPNACGIYLKWNCSAFDEVAESATKLTSKDLLLCIVEVDKFLRKIKLSSGEWREEPWETYKVLYFRKIGELGSKGSDNTDPKTEGSVVLDFLQTSSLF